MIRITVTQKDGAYVSVESEGHADYAEAGARISYVRGYFGADRQCDQFNRDFDR
ncbi:MAG: ribosomal-processing cysteine protease Prp [Lacrimispora saccharolytica]